MLGALFGDLAACTYKQDKQLFERQLVGDESFFSDKGLMALATADALVIRNACTVPTFKAVVNEYFESRDLNKVHFPKWFEAWCGDYILDNDYDSDDGMSLPMCCIAALFDKDLSVKLHHHMLCGKASGYAAHYFTSIIQLIKSGNSKREIFLNDEIGMLPQWVESGSFGNEPFNAINSLILAWIAFDFGFDFTSTIKHATRISVNSDTRVVTMMAATMAEAFYKVDISKLPFPKHITKRNKILFEKLMAFEFNEGKRQRILSELLATHSF